MSQSSNPFPWGKSNYFLMVIGILCITIGYILMSLDKAPYGFGICGLTLGPIVLMIGFIIQFFAIMYKRKQ